MPVRQPIYLLLVAGLVASCGQSQTPDYDLVIRNGTIFDGSGSPGVKADVAIRGDRIVTIGEVSGNASKTVDANGLYVSPGFIERRRRCHLL